MILLARTTPVEEVKKPSEGLSLFFIDFDKAAPGLDLRKIRKMGGHSVDANEVFFDGYRIPANSLIGKEGEGFKIVLHGMNAERCLLAGEALGLGYISLEKAARYAKERVVFGRPIGQNQGIAHPLAAAYMNLEAAKLATYHATKLYDASRTDSSITQQSVGVACNSAKYLAAEAAFAACERAVLTLGGMEYAQEYHVERYMRECFVPRIAPISRWERPSATASSFATVVLFIVASRYLPLIRWALKFLYLSLGVTASAEVGGRLLFSRGLTSSSRPRKYYTIPKDTVESFLEDLESLVDFFLIEFQRILFVENLSYTVLAFVTALTSYWLVMFLPLWGLALIATCVAYLAPLVYITNKELIDSQLGSAQEIVATQTSHVKEMAETQTAQATDIVKQYVGDYRAKANGYIGSTSTPAAAITASEAAPKAISEATEGPTQEPEPAQESVQESVRETVQEDTHEPTAEASTLPDVLQAKELNGLPGLQQVVHADFPDAPTDEPVGEVKEAGKAPELVHIS
ncbi:hypothetical protein MaudMau93_006185 [Microsporum audouinii]